MGKIFDEIDDGLAEFIHRQHVFFVGSAPLDGEGHVNVSPKGLDSFRILGPRKVAYLDLTGSGIETVAHLRENGRIVFMFCAFEGRPRILRLHGRGRVLEPGDAGWDELVGRFPELPGARAIVCAELTRIADSCGWGVPRYAFEGERDQIHRFVDQLGPERLREEQRKENLESLDELPGLLHVDRTDRS